MLVEDRLYARLIQSECIGSFGSVASLQVRLQIDSDLFGQGVKRVC